MNILIVSSLYPEPSSYGIKNDTLVVHYFAKKWVEQGHRVVVLHPYYNAVGNIKHYFDIHSHRILRSEQDGVTVIYGEAQLFVPHALYPAEWRDKLLASRMKKYMKEHLSDFHADVAAVHFPMISHRYVKEILQDIPSMAVFHGTDVRLLASMDETTKNKQVLELDKIYKKYAFRSPMLRKSGCDNGIDCKRTDVIISGIPENLIADPKAIQEKIERKNNPVFRLLYAGKLVKQKRIEHVFEALNLIKDKVDFQFDLIGDGSEQNMLVEFASSLGLSNKVYFHGRKPREEVSSMMIGADAFIMVSTNETLGLVYLEAMAQGAIAIGSKGEGIDGIIVNGENGFLTNPYSNEDIADTIAIVASLSKEERCKIITNAYDYVKGMTDLSMSDRYLASLQSISKRQI